MLARGPVPSPGPSESQFRAMGDHLGPIGGGLVDCLAEFNRCVDAMQTRHCGGRGHVADDLGGGGPVRVGSYSVPDVVVGLDRVRQFRAQQAGIILEAAVEDSDPNALAGITGAVPGQSVRDGDALTGHGRDAGWGQKAPRASAGTARCGSRTSSTSGLAAIASTESMGTHACTRSS